MFENSKSRNFHPSVSSPHSTNLKLKVGTKVLLSFIITSCHFIGQWMVWEVCVFIKRFILCFCRIIVTNEAVLVSLTYILIEIRLTSIFPIVWNAVNTNMNPKPSKITFTNLRSIVAAIWDITPLKRNYLTASIYFLYFDTVLRRPCYTTATFALRSCNDIKQSILDSLHSKNFIKFIE